MRFLPRLFLTWVVFLAYVSGGLIAPVAHRHDGGSCCEHSHSTAAEHSPSHCKTECPFGHESCGESSQKESSPKPVPAFPVDDCSMCQLLSMASDAVDYVVLPTCQPIVVEVTSATTATAFIGDFSSLFLRGPPV